MADVRKRIESEMTYKKYVKTFNEPPKLTKIKPVQEQFTGKIITLGKGSTQNCIVSGSSSFSLASLRPVSNSQPNAISRKTFSKENNNKNNNNNELSNQIMEDSEEEGNCGLDPDEEEHKIQMVKPNLNFKVKTEMDQNSSQNNLDMLDLNSNVENNNINLEENDDIDNIRTKGKSNIFTHLVRKRQNTSQHNI